MVLFFRSSMLVLLSAALLAGCASPPRDAGFSDVQKIAADRTSHELQWRGRTAEDRAVDATIHTMLESELGAEESVQIALLNNRNLQATYEELGIAQAEVVQAGLLRNPVFDASLRFPDGGGKSDLELSVAADFISVLFIPLRKKMAEAEFEAAKWRVADAVEQLAAETRSAYYASQASEQVLDLRRSVVAAQEASADAAKRMHDAGNINDLDLANEQANFEQAKLDLVQAETENLAQRERLTSLMGLWGEQTQWKIAHRLPELPATELSEQGLETRAVADRSELQAAREQITVATKRLGLAQPFGGISEAKIGIDTERDTSGQWVTGPTFSAPLPLFDQGQATIARAQSQLRQAQQQYAARAVEARSEVRTAWARLNAARKRADDYQRIVIPLRRQIVQQTQLQYNGMLVGIFQLLQAKQGEIDAGRAYVEALRDYWLARSELQHAVGGRLDVPMSESPTTQQAH